MSRNYFRVSQAAPAYLLVGHTPGSTFIGSSQAYEPIYQGLLVQPTDEIHELPGGTFLVRDGQALGHFVWQLPEKSILERGGFEKNSPPVPLVAIPEPSVPQRYPNTMELARSPRPWVTTHATPHGRGPVWVLPQVEPVQVEDLQDGDVFTTDGGKTWHTCAVVLFGSVAVYASDDRGEDCDTIRIDAARDQTVLRRSKEQA